MSDNIIKLVHEGLPEGLTELVELNLIRLLRQLNSDTAGGLGVGGLAVAEQVKILLAAVAFLEKRDKFKPPEKPQSGLDRLRATVERRGRPRGTGRRRDSPDEGGDEEST